ncbi:MAG: hypothetical protein EXQ84_04840 [Rhodospirillaceae bacterium]|nr:hypothetical protein [Rhodospirillaceae bacterium]
MTTERNIDWRAITLGTVVAAALAMALVAFGLGLGLSVSSNAERGPPSTAIIGLGLWAVAVGVASAAVGGYLAARLRKRASSATAHENLIHDRAHGLGVWALGVVVTCLFLVVVDSGSGRRVAMNGAGNERANYLVDSLYRPMPPATGEAPGASSTGSTMDAAGEAPVNVQSAQQAERREVARIVRFGTTRGQLSADNRSYVARFVAIATDQTQGEAERRVDQVMAEAGRRPGAARGAFAIVVVLISAGALIAAVAAAWAATLGGRHRDQG